MSDIIERLRADAEHHKEVAGECDCRPEDTVNWDHHVNCLEAAAEIVRLRIKCQRVITPDIRAATIEECAQRIGEIQVALSDLRRRDPAAYNIGDELREVEQLCDVAIRALKANLQENLAGSN